MQLVMGKSPVLFGKKARTSSRELSVPRARRALVGREPRKEQEKSHGHDHHLLRQETASMATRSVREGKWMRRRGRRADGPGHAKRAMA